MSEIREYRGKRVDTGEWVFGDLVRYYENQRLFIAYDEAFYMSESCGMKSLQTDRFFEVDPETVGQWSGETERHSRLDNKYEKIFDGDIVHCYGGEFCQGFWETDEIFKVDITSWEDLMVLGEFEFIEIIHDNPELKGGEYM